MYAEVIAVTADQIHTPHGVWTPLADGQHQFTLSGVLAPHVSGFGPDWRKVTVRAAVPIVGLDPGQTFTVKQSAPFAAVAAVATEGAPAKLGAAVDGFAVVPGGPANTVTLDVHVAVREATTYLLRIAYHVVIVGTAS